jgi:outer membrane protein OmpA-like peptidoglycan-associated protein
MLPKVSMDQYEVMSQVYQAQNAVGIARQANAERYAPTTFAKAQQLWMEAQQFQRDKAEWKRAVQTAREAIQTAEDARLIAERRNQEEQLQAAQAQASQSDQASLQARMQADRDVQRAREEADAAERVKLQAQTDAERARAEAAAARAQAESERIARQRMEAEVARTNAVFEAQKLQDRLIAEKAATRTRLLRELNDVLTSRDTPRGLIVTVPNAAFSGSVLRGPAADQVARISRMVAMNPGLRVEVQGHCESTATEWLSRTRAEDVRDALLRAGLPSNLVVARGMGNSVPIVSNASALGREQNRRVEIIIYGDPIGDQAAWDRMYTLRFRR